MSFKQILYLLCFGLLACCVVGLWLKYTAKKPTIEGITFSLYHGPQKAEPYLHLLPEMAQRLWAGYPHFYAIDLSKGYENVGVYQRSEELITLVARDSKGLVVGLLFGLPLVDGRINRFSPYKNIVAELGVTFKKSFYICETLVEPEFRHRGIALCFYEMLERELKREGKYHRIVRVLMEQPLRTSMALKKHAPRPDRLKDMGYVKTDVVVYSSWKTFIGENIKIVEQRDHPHRLWIKDLTK